MTRVVLIAALALPIAAAAQPSSDAAVHYAVAPDVTVYQPADTTAAYVSLHLREPVFVEKNGGRWALVRTTDGARGVVRAADLSNLWLRISKSRQTVYVYRGPELVDRFAADLGTNFFADKERRGGLDEPDHWRTPEGVFYVASKNPRSTYYRALVLNYPNGEDADRGLRDGLITDAEYQAITEAERRFGVPPMGTKLGGYVEIHGHGTGRRVNWTQGCVAIQDASMDRLWDLVHVGTPVVIDP